MTEAQRAGAAGVVTTAAPLTQTDARVSAQHSGYSSDVQGALNRISAVIQRALWRTMMNSARNGATAGGTAAGRAREGTAGDDRASLP
jgi:hypothetical protein